MYSAPRVLDSELILESEEQLRGSSKFAAEEHIVLGAVPRIVVVLSNQIIPDPIPVRY